MQKAEIQIVRFNSEDVVATSGAGPLYTGFMFTGAYDNNNAENIYYNDASNGKIFGETYNDPLDSSTPIKRLVEFLDPDGMLAMNHIKMENAKFYTTGGKVYKYDPDAGGHYESEADSTGITIDCTSEINDFTSEVSVKNVLRSTTTNSKVDYSFNMVSDDAMQEAECSKQINSDNELTYKYDEFNDEPVELKIKTEEDGEETYNEKVHYADVIESTDTTVGLAHGATSTASLNSLFNSALWKFVNDDGEYKFVQVEGEYEVDTTTGFITKK